MQTMTVQQLKAMMDRNEDFTLINVLDREDFERSRIPGSENVPVSRDDFEDRVEELAGGKDAQIVVYCASFDCEASPKAAKKLDEAGFENVYDFEGGTKEWMRAGHEIERGSPVEAGS